MNHFADILLEHDENKHREDRNVLISETIDEIESTDCINRYLYSTAKYKKFASISLAFGLIVTPCSLDEIGKNNKYNSQIQSEWISSCAEAVNKYTSFNNEHSLTEDEEISVASSFIDEFKRIPAKGSKTIKVNINSVKKGRPSRI